MKIKRDSQIYSKDQDVATTLCIMELVDGLCLSGAYGRLAAWETGPKYKDLDWLFRPLNYTKTQCRKICNLDNTKVFSKEGLDISIQCVMETVGLSRPASHIRCEKWVSSNHDFDWLFRPVYIRKNTKKFMKAQEVYEEKDNYRSGDIEYEIALRKHLGLSVEGYREHIKIMSGK